MGLIIVLETEDTYSGIQNVHAMLCHPKITIYHLKLPSWKFQGFVTIKKALMQSQNFDFVL